MSAEVYGSSQVTSQKALAVRIYMADATNAAVTIYGGTFSSDVAQFVAEGSTYNPNNFTVTT